MSPVLVEQSNSNVNFKFVILKGSNMFPMNEEMVTPHGCMFRLTYTLLGELQMNRSAL